MAKEGACLSPEGFLRAEGVEVNSALAIEKVIKAIPAKAPYLVFAIHFHTFFFLWGLLFLLLHAVGLRIPAEMKILAGGWRFSWQRPC